MAKRVRERREPKGLGFVLAAVIALATVWSYLPGIDGAFVLDDKPAIVDNASIGDWTKMFDAPAGSTLSGRPIAALSFAVSSGFGNTATAHRWGNLLIHIGCALLVLGIARRTLSSLRLPATIRDSAPWLAFAIALIWAVHPLNTGAVTYIVQRVESLMGLFYLLTLYAVIVAETSPHRHWWWTLAIAACALGMATKEVMVSAPIVAWLWLFVFAGAPANPFTDRRHRWIFAGLALTWGILAALQTTDTQGRKALEVALHAGATGEGWTPWRYLLTQSDVIVHYVRLVFVPTLAFDDYGWPQARSIVDVLPQAIVLLTAVALVGWGLVRRRPEAFAGAWFFLILAPTSSLLPIPTEIAAEHRMYLPGIAVIAVVLTALSTALSRMPRPAVAWTGGITVLAIAVPLAAATRARGRDYESAERLWADTIDKRPANLRARVNYGVELMAHGRYGEAETQMRAATQLDGDPETRAQAFVQLGAALCAQARCADGAPYIERALELDPNISDADAVLGQSYSDAGDIRKAVFYLRRAVSHDPNRVPLLTRLAWLLATTADPSVADPPAAIDYAERAVTLTSGRSAPAFESLAAAYFRAGRPADAVKAATAAVAEAERAGDRQSAAILRQQLAAYQDRSR